MRDEKKYAERHSSSMSQPANSLSRQLDDMVCAQEAPYGYSDAPPPYWHQNAESLENQKLQHSKKGR